MTNKHTPDHQEFLELSSKQYHVETEPSTIPVISEPTQQTGAFDAQGLAFIFAFGAFVISLLCLYKVFKKDNQPSHKTTPKRPRPKEPILGIRPEFIQEAKSERKHRQEQRRKYGIFDDDGNRLD